MNSSAAKEARTIAEEVAWARELSMGGLFIALGIVLPVVFHALGAGRLGPVLLPMYLPVLVAGMLLSPGTAAAVGLLTPTLSSALTGMPPILPALPFLAAELSAMGLIASLLHRRLRMPVMLATPVTVLAGRAVVGMCVVLAVNLLPANVLASLPRPMQNPWAYLIAASMVAQPGLALQLIVVPAVVMMAEHNLRRFTERRD